jgi:hypothetical protein
MLETNMGGENSKEQKDTVQLTKIGRSFMNSGALGLKRQCQIFDGMVTGHASKKVKRKHDTR